MKFYNVVQNSEEWFDLRKGRATASHFGEIMVNCFDKDFNYKPSAAWGKQANDYAMRIALERITDKRMENGYTNEWMERGHELEPVARAEYENQTFTDVTNGGFICDDDCGASSDGLVKDGGIEIKSVKYNTHFERLIKGGYDTKYRWQIIGNIWAYNLQWLDFVSFCPEFPEEKQLYIFRVKRDDTAINYLNDRLNSFKTLIETYQAVLK